MQNSIFFIGYNNCLFPYQENYKISVIYSGLMAIYFFLLGGGVHALLHWALEKLEMLQLHVV